MVSAQRVAAFISAAFLVSLMAGCGASGASDQGYATTRAWAHANPNTLQAFDIALEAGQQIADTNRQAVEAALAALPRDKGGIDRRTAALLTLSYYPLGITPVRLQRVAEIMQEFGFLRQRFDISQLLD